MISIIILNSLVLMHLVRQVTMVMKYLMADVMHWKIRECTGDKVEFEELKRKTDGRIGPPAPRH